MKVSMVMCVGWLAAAALASSCGGGSKGSGAAADGGDGAVQCPPTDIPEAEPPLDQFGILDGGGLPLTGYARALATARCHYYSRCFGLANYAANDCSSEMVALGNWGYTVCRGDFPDKRSCGGYLGNFNGGARADLLNAAIAGTVHYDEQRAAACFAALLTAPCIQNSVPENIPACVGVFSCNSPSDGGAGAADGGADAADGGADAGVLCAEADLVNNFALKTCTTDDECAGQMPPASGPHCVGGFCAPTGCGFAPYCTGFVQAGEACDVTATSFIDPTTPQLNRVCAPGLACQFATADAGAGTCIQPQDVGAPCTLLSDCKPGLSCTCGTCAIPPSSGPCVDSQCKYGVAYCDLSTNVCKPVAGHGQKCSAAFGCQSGLTCDLGGSNTCQLP